VTLIDFEVRLAPILARDVFLAIFMKMKNRRFDLVLHAPIYHRSVWYMFMNKKNVIFVESERELKDEKNYVTYKRVIK
jgi:hypothetical protein